MYLIEEQIAGGDADQISFLKTKFEYNSIIECLCSICLDMNDLRDAFDTDVTYSQITAFQFNGIEYDIDDVDLLTPAYLEQYGQIQQEEDLLVGKEITFVNLGRIGFVLTITAGNQYTIHDVLGNDITTIVFDRVYDSETLTETYVSKTHYVPSTVYFKFIKT